MAKKTSAKSKGYRKKVAEKPYLTKKEIMIAACVVLVAILVFVLVNALYSDGSLKVINGAVVVDGENSLIINADQSGATARYFKLGQAHDVEGYTLEVTPSSIGDDNMPTFTYAPTDASNPIDAVSIAASPNSASLMMNAMTAFYSSYATTDGIEIGTASEFETEDGKKVSYFTYTIDDAVFNGTGVTTTDETEEEVYNFYQYLRCYVEVSENSCINIVVYNMAQTQEGCLDEAQLLDVAKQFANSLTYETK